MAASPPSDVHPAQPEPSRSDELTPPHILTTKENKQPSEEADIGSHHPVCRSQSPRDPISESQECSSSLPSNSEGERRGHESSIATATSTTVVGREAVIHPETSCCLRDQEEEEEDVCEGCGRSRAEGKRLLKLEREVRRLKETLREKDDLIARLWEDNARKTAELLEFQLQKVHVYRNHVGRC